MRNAIILGVAVVMMATVANATLITGNPGSWNGSDGEWTMYGWAPVFENITVGDPGGGQSYQAQSVTLTVWGPSSGIQAYLIPGTIGNSVPYTDNRPSAVATGTFSGPFGADAANATTATVTFNSPATLAAGQYYLELWTLDPTTAFARDGGANSYAGGAEGYYGGGASTYINGSYDLVFSLNGAVVPEPATLALLGIGGLATLLRRRSR